MSRVTPDSDPRDILLSLSKEELVEWIIARRPLDSRERARDARWFATERRYERLDAEWRVLLERMREERTGEELDVAARGKLLAENDRCMRRSDALLAEMDLWGRG